MDLIQRAGRELEAARTLLDGGFFAQAVSRAYFGAFYAAEAALLAVGETRSKHAGVVSGFGKHIVKEGGFPEDVGRLLRRLFEARNEADYASDEVPEAEARAALADAQAFVTEVRSWMPTERP